MRRSLADHAVGVTADKAVDSGDAGHPVFQDVVDFRERATAYDGQTAVETCPQLLQQVSAARIGAHIFRTLGDGRQRAVQIEK